MARNRIKIAYITNNAARKATYKKRKMGLVKKVSELSTLCGVEACAVIYSPTCDSQPEVWPSAATAYRMLSDFKALPAAERSNRMMSQESLIRQTIAKANEQMKRLDEENRIKELTQVMFQNLGGKGLITVEKEDLNDLSLLIDRNLIYIHNRLHMLIEAYVVQKK